MKEAAIVRKLMLAVKRHCPNAWVNKLSDSFTRGLPDVIIIAPRLLQITDELSIFALAVETKTKTGRQSAIQKQEQKAWGKLPSNCARYVLARGKDAVKEVLDILHEQGCW